MVFAGGGGVSFTVETAFNLNFYCRKIDLAGFVVMRMNNKYLLSIHDVPNLTLRAKI